MMRSRYSFADDADGEEAPRATRQESDSRSGPSTAPRGRGRGGNRGGRGRGDVRSRDIGKSTRYERVDPSKVIVERPTPKPKRETEVKKLGKVEKDIVEEKSTRLKHKLNSAQLEICRLALGLTVEKMFFIRAIDHLPDRGLVMVHHAEDVDPKDTDLTSIRGTIIDLKRKRILVPSTSYKIHSTVSPLIGSPDQPEFRFFDEELYDLDEDGMQKPVVHVVPNDASVKIRPHIPGVDLRFFLHDGYYYLASHGKIDVTGSSSGTDPSRWGAHLKYFADAYYEAGGPLHTDLFPEGARFSRFVYCFRVYWPSYNLNSQIKSTSKGFVIHTNTIDTWAGVPESPYTAAELGTPHVKPAEFEYEDDPALNSGLGQQRRLTLMQANYFLTFGYQDEPHVLVDGTRSGPGESVILTYKQGGAKIRLHVKSLAYYNRDTNIFGNENNVYMRYVMFNDIAYKATKDIRNVLCCYSMFKLLPEDEYKKFAFDGEYLYDKLQLEDPIPAKVTYKQAYRYIWHQMLISSSQYYAPQVINFPRRLKADLANLKTWLMSFPFAQQVKVPDVMIAEGRPASEKTKGRVAAILKLAYELSTREHDRIKKEKNRAPHPQSFRLSFISSILRSEEGSSLYRLIRVANAALGRSTLSITEPWAVTVLQNPLMTKADIHFLKYDPNRDVPIDDRERPDEIQVFYPKGEKSSTWSGMVRGAEIELARIEKVKAEKEPELRGKSVVIPELPYYQPATIYTVDTTDEETEVEMQELDLVEDMDEDDVSVPLPEVVVLPGEVEDAEKKILESVPSRSTEVSTNARDVVDSLFQEEGDEKSGAKEREKEEEEDSTVGTSTPKRLTVLDMKGDGKRYQSNYNWADIEDGDDDDLYAVKVDFGSGLSVEKLEEAYFSGHSRSHERDAQESPSTRRSVVENSTYNIDVPKGQVNVKSMEEPTGVPTRRRMRTPMISDDVADILGDIDQDILNSTSGRSSSSGRRSRTTPKTPYEPRPFIVDAEEEGARVIQGTDTPLKYRLPVIENVPPPVTGIIEKRENTMPVIEQETFEIRDEAEKPTSGLGSGLIDYTKPFAAWSRQTVTGAELTAAYIPEQVKRIMESKKKGESHKEAERRMQIEEQKLKREKMKERYDVLDEAIKNIKSEGGTIKPKYLEEYAQLANELKKTVKESIPKMSRGAAEMPEVTIPRRADSAFVRKRYSSTKDSAASRVENLRMPNRGFVSVRATAPEKREIEGVTLAESSSYVDARLATHSSGVFWVDSYNANSVVSWW